MSLGTVWRQLLDGRFRIAGTWSDGERARMVLQTVEQPLASIRSRSVEILERVLLAEQPKVLAVNRGVGTSTIATHCTNVLRAIGCTENCLHVSFALVMAVHRARGISVLPSHVDRAWISDNCLSITVRIPSPDTHGRLSASETQVARLAIAGKSCAEIARRRKTAFRTVANQMATIFQKLGISGRAELRATAVRGLAAKVADPKPVARGLPCFATVRPATRVFPVPLARQV
jgi:DNA-binding NarL/FixJ family response regulator